MKRGGRCGRVVFTLTSPASRAQGSVGQNSAVPAAGCASLVPLTAVFSSHCDSLHHNPCRETKGISSPQFPLWSVQVRIWGDCSCRERRVQTSSHARVVKQLPWFLSASESPHSSLDCRSFCKYSLFLFLSSQNLQRIPGLSSLLRKNVLLTSFQKGKDVILTNIE